MAQNVSLSADDQILSANVIYRQSLEDCVTLAGPSESGHRPFQFPVENSAALDLAYDIPPSAPRTITPTVEDMYDDAESGLKPQQRRDFLASSCDVTPTVLPDNDADREDHLLPGAMRDEELEGNAHHRRLPVPSFDALEAVSSGLQECLSGTGVCATATLVIETSSVTTGWRATTGGVTQNAGDNDGAASSVTATAASSERQQHRTPPELLAPWMESSETSGPILSYPGMVHSVPESVSRHRTVEAGSSDDDESFLGARIAPLHGGRLLFPPCPNLLADDGTKPQLPSRPQRTAPLCPPSPSPDPEREELVPEDELSVLLASVEKLSHPGDAPVEPDELDEEGDQANQDKEVHFVSCSQPPRAVLPTHPMRETPCGEADAATVTFCPRPAQQRQMPLRSARLSVSPSCEAIPDDLSAVEPPARVLSASQAATSVFGHEFDNKEECDGMNAGSSTPLTIPLEEMTGGMNLSGTGGHGYCGSSGEMVNDSLSPLRSAAPVTEEPLHFPVIKHGVPSAIPKMCPPSATCRFTHDEGAMEWSTFSTESNNDGAAREDTAAYTDLQRALHLSSERCKALEAENALQAATIAELHRLSGDLQKKLHETLGCEAQHHDRDSARATIFETAMVRESEERPPHSSDSVRGSEEPVVRQQDGVLPAPLSSVSLSIEEVHPVVLAAVEERCHVRCDALASQLMEAKRMLSEQSAVLDRLGLHPPYAEELVGSAWRTLGRLRKLQDSGEATTAAALVSLREFGNSADGSANLSSLGGDSGDAGPPSLHGPVLEPLHINNSTGANIEEESACPEGTLKTRVTIAAILRQHRLAKGQLMASGTENR